MMIDEVEAEALKLDPKARARLAEKLLASLDDLSEDEAARAEERDRSPGRRRSRVNLVADEGVDAAIVEALRGDGHDVYYVAEQQPGLTDSEVLEQATQRNAILLTPDQGFGELVFLQHCEVPGVLLLRLVGLGLVTEAARAPSAPTRLRRTSPQLKLSAVSWTEVQCRRSAGSSAS